MSGNMNFPEKVVVLRTGGLGDFVLSVPLLISLIERGCQVTIATRRSFYDILGDFQEKIPFFDADEILIPDDRNTPEEIFEGATVLSFWRDRDSLLKDRLGVLGILDLVEFESRPETPPHLTQRIFQRTGIQWEEGFLSRSWLGLEGLSGKCLWVHPGSGSPAKNAPCVWFLERIERWLAKGEGDSVIVSIGEADLEVEQSFRENGGALPLKFIHPKTFRELRDGLVVEAALFVGNDSGPSHLAAALGIPSEIVFTTTNPGIWRPVGEKVTIVRASELD